MRPHAVTMQLIYNYIIRAAERSTHIVRIVWFCAKDGKSTPLPYAKGNWLNKPNDSAKGLFSLAGIQ